MKFNVKFKCDALDSLVHEMRLLNKSLRKIAEEINPSNAAQISFWVDVDGNPQRTVHMVLKVSSPTKRFSIKIGDKFRNPAQVDGAPKWSLTNESLATVVAADDGMSAMVTPLGPVGSCKIQVHADPDLTSAVADLFGEMDLDLIAGDAVSIDISADPDPVVVPEVPPTV